MNVGTIVEADMLKVRLVRVRRGDFRQDDPAPKRTAAGRGRGIFHRDAGARRHVCVRAAKFWRSEGMCRERGLCLARQLVRRRPRFRPTRAASFRSPPISPMRVREHHVRRPPNGSTLPEQVARMARNCRNCTPLMPRADELLVETFPRGQQISSGLLSVRGQARASDLWDAAHAPARTRRTKTARLRRQ